MSHPDNHTFASYTITLYEIDILDASKSSLTLHDLEV
jgi:hypothetical protein